MAKRVKGSDAAQISNGFDGDKVKSFVNQIEAFLTDLESEKGSYMRKCKGIRDSMEEVFDSAKNAGIPKKVLKAHIDLRKLEAKKRTLVDRLDGDDADTFEMVSEALGDFATLPLGMAAIRQAGGDAADRDALASLN